MILSVNSPGERSSWLCHTPFPSPHLYWNKGCLWRGHVHKQFVSHYLSSIWKHQEHCAEAAGGKMLTLNMEWWSNGTSIYNKQHHLWVVGKHKYCRSYFISQKAQLCEEVLSQLEFISHCAFLHLGPHGLRLLANGLLKPETVQHLARQDKYSQSTSRRKALLLYLFTYHFWQAQLQSLPVKFGSSRLILVLVCQGNELTERGGARSVWKSILIHSSAQIQHVITMFG